MVLTEKKAVQTAMMLRTGNLKQKGFTLIEIIIVMAVIVVVSAVVLPDFLSMVKSEEYKSQQRAVLNILISAREKAIVEKRKVGVTVNNNKLIIDGQETELKNKIKIAEATPTAFYKDGTSDGGEYSFSTEDNRTFAISIDKITGKIAIKD